MVVCGKIKRYEMCDTNDITYLSLRAGVHSFIKTCFEMDTDMSSEMSSHRVYLIQMKRYVLKLALLLTFYF